MNPEKCMLSTQILNATQTKIFHLAKKLLLGELHFYDAIKKS